MGIGLHFLLDLAIDLGEDVRELQFKLVQGQFQRWELAQELSQRNTMGGHAGSPADQFQDALLRSGPRRPRAQLLAVFGRIAGDDLGIRTVGLAAAAKRLGIEEYVLRVQNIDAQAGLQRQAQQVLSTR